MDFESTDADLTRADSPHLYLVNGNTREKTVETLSAKTALAAPFSRLGGGKLSRKLTASKRATGNRSAKSTSNVSAKKKKKSSLQNKTLAVQPLEQLAAAAVDGAHILTSLARVPSNIPDDGIDWTVPVNAVTQQGRVRTDQLPSEVAGSGIIQESTTSVSVKIETLPKSNSSLDSQSDVFWETPPLTDNRRNSAGE